MFLVKYFISLLLLAMPNTKCLGSELSGLTSESMCYLTNSSYEEECVKKKNLTVSFRNGSDSGVIIAEVELPPKACNYSRFDVILFKKENDTDDQYCTVNGVGYRHSWKTYRRIKCESDKCPNVCEKTAKFTFYLIKNGEYFLNVRGHFVEIFWKDYYSDIFSITTNFKKSSATEVRIRNVPSIVRETVSFNLTFTKPTSAVNIYLQDKNTLLFEGIELKSSNIMQVNNSCKITLEEDEPRNKGKIKGVLCAWKNVPERKLKLYVNFAREDNCDDGMRVISITSEENAKCVCWKTEEYAVNIEMDEENGIPFLIPVLVMIVFLVAGLVLLFLWRHRNQTPRRRWNDDDTSNSLLLKSDIEILLLYPRDCPQFMKLMTSLKILLETSYQVKVHDFYDPYCQEALNGPNEWFQLLMHRMGLCTIIVATQCAYIQQEARISQAKCQYEQPHFLDDFFMYGFTQMQRNFSQDVYRKIYVVQINGFSDVELKCLPTAFTRYKLPDHFDKLFTAMNLISPTGVSKELNMLNRGAYRDFIKYLEELKTFKKQNEDYLSQMLSIRIS